MRLTQKLSKWMKSPKVARGYAHLSVILLNSLLIFFLLNVLAELLLAGNVPTGALTYDDSLLARAYPDWDPEERKLMLKEIWGRQFQCASYTHYREEPFQGKYLHVDEEGFRWNAERPPWPLDEEAYNIFVFGGSTTFGYGLPDSQTIPAQIEERLSGDFDHPVHVYNFAQASYFSSLELALFTKLIRQGAVPDMAIFIDGLNDFQYWEPDPPHMKVCAEPDHDSLTIRIPLMRLAREIRSDLMGPQPLNLENLNVYEEKGLAVKVLERYKTNRELIDAVAARYGITTLFVWQPVPAYHYDLDAHIFVGELKYLYLGIYAKPGYEEMARRVDEWREWENFLYLADVQLGRQEPLYIDWLHYSADFCREIAGYIVQFMLTARHF